MKVREPSFARNMQVLSSMVLLLSLFSWNAAYAQITPSQDACTNTADATTNYGAGTLLYVHGSAEITYIQFDLASIPAGASISQATLTGHGDRRKRWLERRRIDYHDCERSWSIR